MVLCAGHGHRPKLAEYMDVSMKEDEVDEDEDEGVE